MYTFFIFWACFPLNCAEKSCIHFRYSVVANERIIRDCAWFGWFKFFFYVRRNKKPYMLNSALVFVEYVFCGKRSLRSATHIVSYPIQASPNIVTPVSHLVPHDQDYRGCYCLTHRKSLLYYIRHSSL